MESKLFNIGDIVALKSHPYYENNKEVIISGDPLAISPLMIVSEVFKSSDSFAGTKHDTYKYICLWFSPKTYKFEDATIVEEDLKLIQKRTNTVNTDLIKRGDRLNFKTAVFELGKKKSSLSCDDNTINSAPTNTTIHAMLSFVSPVLQVVNYAPHKSKHVLADKKSNLIREVSSIDVKMSWFDPHENRVTERILPIEALELIEEIKEKRIEAIKKVIKNRGNLLLKAGRYKTLIRPRNLTYRGGYYYLRAYDYLANKIEEFEFKNTTKLTSLDNLFDAEAPKFDIEHKAGAATQEYIKKEIIELITDAILKNAFIRFKYKNRNDQLSNRTISKFELITVKEGHLSVTYLVGYCYLRQEKRTFRIDRIQSIQMLALTFK